VAVGVITIGTLLHRTTQAVTAVLLLRKTQCDAPAMMTLRGSAASFGVAACSATAGLLVEASGFTALGTSTPAHSAAGARAAGTLAGARQAQKGRLMNNYSAAPATGTGTRSSILRGVGTVLRDE
jgi:hypothetical protein